MTKEEILLEEAIEACENPNGKIAVYIAMDRYADQQTASLREQLEALKKENEWISVEDSMPEVGQMVDTWNGLVNRRAKFEKPDLFIRHVEPFSNERIYVTHFPDITHWKPLPQPPK